MSSLQSSAPDLFVVGAGRSGTSLVASLMASVGYHVGDKLLEPTYSNPKGYFQDADVIRINEEILSACLPTAPNHMPQGYGWDFPRRGQYWLARIPPNSKISVNDAQLSAISQLTEKKPFCLKDPRFSYTCNIWSAFARSPKFICVFRHPSAFVSSVFELCLREETHADIAISVQQLFESWYSTYNFILRRHATDDWLFLDYDDFFYGDAIRTLEKFCECELDRTILDNRLRHSVMKANTPQPVLKLYNRLKSKAKCTFQNGS